MGNLRVGMDVDAWCSRCGLVLSHTVEALVGDDIKRVHCNTCKAQHAYRPHAPGEGPKPTPRAREDRPRRAGGAGLARASDYETYLQGRDPSDARRYSPKLSLRQGDLIEHPTFGLGIATGLKDGGKVEVLFRDGPRVLIHGR